MIPIQLTLRNFLSYRDAAELDLSGIHLACISGLNGAGKSTILDGITWALFGKSRVKSDDDIVNRITTTSGAAAEVAFIFELEGAVYRIIRRKAAGKTGELEFHARARDDEGQRWQVKTEAKLKETQAEIEKLLRMNYDVFTNASFLLQGKADEFTTKTPDKRKEILADILGVNQWDAYKELATERRKVSDFEATTLDRQLAEVEAELAEEESRNQELGLAETHTSTVTAERDRQEALVTVARQNKTLADHQRESLKRLITDIGESERELGRNESISAQRRAELEAYQALIDRRDAIEASFKEWQSAEADFAEWQEKADQHGTLVREKHPLEMAIARMETQLEQRLKELELQRERAEKAAVELKTLQDRVGENQKRLKDNQKRAAEVVEEERAWQDAQNRVKQIGYEQKILQQELIQLETRAQEIEKWESQRVHYTASRLEADKSLAKAVNELVELDVQRNTLAEKKGEKVGLEGEQKRLKDEMDDLVDRIAQLTAETDHDCPLCGQPLTPDHRQTVLGKLKSDGDSRGAQFRRNKVAIANLEQEIQALEKALLRQKGVEKDRESHQESIVRFETRLQDLEKHLTAWRGGDEIGRIAEINTLLADETETRELTERIESFKLAADEARRLNQERIHMENLVTRDQTRSEELERVRWDWEQTGQPASVQTQRQLAGKAYAAAERSALAELEARIATVGHDPDALADAKTRRASLATAPEDHQKLQQADAAVKLLVDGLADLDEQRERLVARVTDLEDQRVKTTQLLQELEAGIVDLPAAEAELHKLREQVIAAIRAVGGARQKVAVLATRREDRQKLTIKRTEVVRRVGLMRQLEEACGRKGVQAMLIEVSLPEIEDYANELLDRLTGGDMRVAFETQKAAKTKQDNLIETLDIKISDSTGERPYENYSGGEKFRINFAIRLALSQVLARRAGARLQTLVIDEGFGSQDPEGRQRLVEAINAVQDKFACILVITHIDELRDKFPARIDVEKTATGSRLSVVTA